MLLLDNDADPRLKNSRGYAAGTGVTGDKQFVDPGRDLVDVFGLVRTTESQFDNSRAVLTQLMDAAEDSKHANDKECVVVSPTQSLAPRPDPHD